MKARGLCVLAAVVSMGCATLFNADREPVSISSNPGDAEVYVNGTLRGRTPLTLELQPNEEYEIMFRKDGREMVFELNNHVGAGWVVLDVLGGLVPVIIDAATGSWYEFDTKVVNVNLPAS